MEPMTFLLVGDPQTTPVRATFLFLERGKEGDVWVASRVPPTGDLARNPDTCPDWELNQQPFHSQAGVKPLSHTGQGLLGS